MCNVQNERKHSVSASLLLNNNNNTLPTSSNMLWSQLPHLSSSSYRTQEVGTNTQTENGIEDATMNIIGKKTLQSLS